jgi:CRISPR-associated endonuclease/helicase Cas3
VFSFEEFFRALHGVDPFPWQARLAQQVMESGWPNTIDLPTASGKTACLDIALFHLATAAVAPRRIFYVVDRRVVVNSAFERMKKIKRKLIEAQEGPLRWAADQLREIAGGSLPLGVFELRGGIYQDQSWVASPLQPLVVGSTVDQVGSRLLFRGYGVSASTAPIHAALVAQDSLILLDEAHCSRAFSQTLAALRRYCGEWTIEKVAKPFQVVEMTATPAFEGGSVFRLNAEDRGPKSQLEERLTAKKPVELKELRGATALADEALRMTKEGGIRRVAVMVNRIATARETYEKLRARCDKEEGSGRVHLLIGRMRPIDRDDLMGDLRELESGSPRGPGEPVFVVATQTLEVGADLDFDAMVSECASIDALLQRFGRLDRIGTLKGSARGVVVKLDRPKEDDPVYGSALLRTWQWLAAMPQPLNFGIESRDPDSETVAERLALLDPATAFDLRRTSPDAPILLPSHLDALVQTEPAPHVEPEIALFLHGPKSGPADVQVVWRADLRQDDTDSWAKTVSAFPPLAAEALPARVWDVQRWMRGETLSQDDHDLEGAEGRSDGTAIVGQRKRVLIWRGKETGAPTSNARDVKPGSTIVIAASEAGSAELGFVPPSGMNGASVRDWAERALWTGRRRVQVRLHPATLDELGRLHTTDGQKAEWFERLESLIKSPEWDGEAFEEIREAWRNSETLGASADTLAETLLQILPHLEPSSLQVERYPEEGSGEGWLLKRRGVVKPETEAEQPVILSGEDAGDDELTFGQTANRRSLAAHTQDVIAVTKQFASALPANLVAPFRQAAQWHDVGKADIRFQTLLWNGDRLAAQMARHQLAKSASASTVTPRRRARHLAQIPDNFRHELLSLQMAEMHLSQSDEAELILHLIASHHGYCRPFAPVVCDPLPGTVAAKGFFVSPANGLLIDDSAGDTSAKCLSIAPAERVARPPHHFGSGVSRRFWSLTRRFGWWGLAYLESILRLADWEASRLAEDQR